MHLVALPPDVGLDGLLTSDPRLLLFDEAVSYSLELRPNGVQIIVVVTDAVCSLSVDPGFEVVPTALLTSDSATYILSWLAFQVSLKMPASLSI